MSITLSSEAVTYAVHGSTFSSYVSPARGSKELCAWRLNVPSQARGVSHRPSREEVLLVLEGRLILTLDGLTSDLGPGDVALVPAGSQLRVDAGPCGGAAWVTSTPGLQAVLADGSVLTPPWAN